MKDICFMHIQREQVVWHKHHGPSVMDVLRFPKGLNPSEHSPSLTFLLSAANSEYKLSNDFHASPSVKCLNTLSFVQLFTCHFIWAVVYDDINNLCSLGMSENHRNTFTGHFLLDNMS
jgi:hypothetical protein